MGNSGPQISLEMVDELNQVAHGLKWGRKIIEAMGGVVNNPDRTAETIEAGGQIIREVGTSHGR